MSAVATPRPVLEVSFEFIADLEIYKTERPYNISCGVDVPEEYRTNIQTEWHHNIPIQDVRGQEHELSFDKDGFKYLVSDCKLGTRFGEAETLADLEEATRLLQEDINAEKIICYDIRLRASDAARNCELVSENRSQSVKPVTMAHTDHTREGGLRRVARHLTARERKEYLTGNYRCRIINLWKPLIEVLEDNPLAICDPSSVAWDDIFEVDRVGEDWVGVIYFLKYNPEQKWRWLSKQKMDEICAFVTFDSQPKEELNFCPHASFVNLTAPPGSTLRRSVEIRVIVFNKVEHGTGAVHES